MGCARKAARIGLNPVHQTAGGRIGLLFGWSVLGNERRSERIVLGNADVQKGSLGFVGVGCDLRDVRGEEIRLDEVERELAEKQNVDEPLVKQDLLALPLREAREQFERAYLSPKATMRSALTVTDP